MSLTVLLTQTKPSPSLHLSYTHNPHTHTPYPKKQPWAVSHPLAWPAKLPSADDLSAAWAAAVGVATAPPIVAEEEAAVVVAVSTPGPATPRAASPTVPAPAVVPAPPAPAADDWAAAASLLLSAATSHAPALAAPPLLPPIACWMDAFPDAPLPPPHPTRARSLRGPGTPVASECATPTLAPALLLPRRPTRARSAAAAAAARAAKAAADKAAAAVAAAVALAADAARPEPTRPRPVALAAWRAKKARRAAGLARPPPAILYQKRKDNADRRPRVQGRFLSREAAAAHFAALTAAEAAAGGPAAWA